MKRNHLVMMLLTVLFLFNCCNSRENVTINQQEKQLRSFYEGRNKPLLGKTNSQTDPDPYPHCDNIPTFSRPLDKNEIFFYTSFFPKLDTSISRITSISTQCYNCVSWTLGITNEWLWPDGGFLLPSEKSTKLEYFDEFYKKLGYTKTTDIKDADVEAWGIDNGVDPLYMTHASVRYTPDRTVWESKLGALQRLTHKADDLESDTYGKVRAYYKKSSDVNIKELVKGQQTPKFSPTHTQYDALLRRLLPMSDEDIDRFNNLYFDWKSEWFTGKYGLSSNPADRRLTPSYQKLKNLGEDIIPLVVGRMLLYNDEFFALQLYNDLQKNPNLKISNNHNVLEGEKSKANRTVALYLKSIE
ncbi:DUF7689 domain-containing protein [Riemerella columbipharyngis]|uniref:DUF7689 domain-containing protein n=1 Tax=Riemerella columbipharyngis TaxID=1071918 RepID=A0A1G7DI65_9FLAO|nr:hypothetical protein [Riemerella columbipharyngis]SDE51201.1 hypothetical protein SAMN05421544_11132 [Riemerella columbipharyngis]